MARLQDFVVRIKPRLEEAQLNETVNKISSRVRGAVGGAGRAVSRGISTASHGLNIIKMLASEIQKVEQSTRKSAENMGRFNDVAQDYGATIGQVANAQIAMQAVDINTGDFEAIMGKVSEMRLSGDSPLDFGDSDNDLANTIALFEHLASMENEQAKGLISQLFKGDDMRKVANITNTFRSEGSTINKILADNYNTTGALTTTFNEQQKLNNKAFSDMSVLEIQEFLARAKTGALGEVRQADIQAAQMALQQARLRSENNPQGYVQGSIQTQREVTNTIEQLMQSVVSSLTQIVMDIKNGESLLTSVINNAVKPVLFEGIGMIKEELVRLFGNLITNIKEIPKKIGAAIAFYVNPLNWGKPMPDIPNSNLEEDFS
jgi:hypothetical protein